MDDSSDDGTKDRLETAQTFGQKALAALSVPQNYLAGKAASAVGLQPAPDAETNFANMADLASDKLGVPRDSAMGNAAKAGLVAGGVLFADPLNLVPGGKELEEIAKAGKAAGAVEKAAQFGKVFVKDAPALENFGKVVLKDAPEAKSLGKVIIKDSPSVVPALQDQAARAKYADEMAKALKGNAELITNESSRQTPTIAKQFKALQRAQK